jgi:biopolymer transport protein ExbD
MLFFLVTVKMDLDQTNPEVKLGMAPNGPAIEQKDPRTVIIEVDRKGRITISGVPMTKAYLAAILQRAVSQQGFGIPILIRGDFRSKHADIRAVMDTCSGVGLWRIRFAAIKQKTS